MNNVKTFKRLYWVVTENCVIHFKVELYAYIHIRRGYRHISYILLNELTSGGAYLGLLFINHVIVVLFSATLISTPMIQVYFPCN